LADESVWMTAVLMVGEKVGEKAAWTAAQWGGQMVVLWAG